MLRLCARSHPECMEISNGCNVQVKIISENLQVTCTFVYCFGCRKKLSCKARGPVIGKRSITEAKGLYLAGAAIDVRFEFGYGISLYPFVKNIVKWGRGFWNYQYKNPEDNCKLVEQKNVLQIIVKFD